MRIPLSSISLTPLEVGYARDALESGWISSSGPYVGRFERALAAKIGRKHVTAVLNGTTALELALRGLGIGPGDEVIVPALTFVAPAAVVVTVGASPVFADVTPETWTVDPAEVKRLVTRRTRAAIAVDVLGHPCDFAALSALGIPVVEDAAEAHGALFHGSPTGSFGVISVFSFFANKTISTGEGGCVATDDAGLADRMRLVASHGMTKERPYWHDVVGHNFAMTNVAAAVGLGQVERWDELVGARNAVARRYDQLLGGMDGDGFGRRPVAPWAREACWLYTVTAPQREALVSALRDAGIDARGIWTALPDLPLYANAVRGDYPVARRIARTALWLPTFAQMSEDQIRDVASTLADALQGQAAAAAISRMP